MMGFDLIKLALSVTIGAGIGSIVATRITYWQLERKFGFDLEELGEDISVIRNVLKDWHEFSESEESQILAERVVGVIDRVDRLSKAVENNPLINPKGGGSNE